MSSRHAIVVASTIHRVSKETELAIEEYLGQHNLDAVKVRVNQYNPSGEWYRLRENSDLAWPVRHTFGAASLVVGRRKQTVCYLTAAGGEPKADSLLSEGRQLVDCGGGRGKTAGRRPARADDAACGVTR